MELHRNETTRLTRDGNLLWFEIARPPSNTLVESIFLGVDHAMEVFETGPDRVLVLTGQGNVFCKGADLQVLHSCPDRPSMHRELEQTNGLFSRVARSPKPTLAAINGYCFGGGLELALCCHFRVVKEKTRLGLPEVWGGMIPGLGGIRRLCRLLGPAKALELIALGELVTSEDALRLGLVSRVFPKGRFEEDARGFARALAGVPARAMDRLLALCRAESAAGEEDAVRAGWEAFRDVAPWLQQGGGTTPPVAAPADR